MQMRVRILPYYKKGFKKAYPKIAHSLRHLDQPRLEDDPSLYDLVGKLDKLLYELEGNPPERNVFLAKRKALFTLYEEVQKRIADRQLAQADQALYKMEDTFDEIERELGEI